MTYRERLTEIVDKAKEEYANDITDHTETEYIVESLLNEGVIVPPCKVGQTVYVPSGDEGNDWIDEYKVKYFYCSSKGINRIYIECGTMGNNFRPKDIGKTVFLAKEEAEKKLKELKQDE